MSSQLKLCGACKRMRPLSEFAFKNKATGRLQSRCKDCAREYAKQHYDANRQAYVEKAKANNSAYRERNAALVAQLLEVEACTGCGTTDNLTYYTGGVEEGQPVHMAVHGGLSQETVLAAVARSVVVCRHCLGQHFGKSLEFWQKLNARQRKELREARERQGHVPVPRDYYKAYRRTDGSIAGF